VKVFVSVDMEGVGGVVDRSQLLPDGALYGEARRYLADEVRVVAAAAWDAGATAVTVNDAHDGMLGVPWDVLDTLPAPTVLVSGAGKPWSMLDGLEGHDVAVFLGYHAMAGTPSAVMDHTYSRDVYRLVLNDREVGEVALNALVAGRFGVPVGLVSGDAAVARETAAVLPDAETVVTKVARGRRAARLFAPAEVRERLRVGVQRALARFGGPDAPRPLTLSGPARLRVQLLTTQAADMAELVPDCRRVDGRTVEIAREDLLDAYRAFRAVLRMVAGLPLY
jgi:D-amino peptidase